MTTLRIKSTEINNQLIKSLSRRFTPRRDDILNVVDFTVPDEFALKFIR